VLSELKRDPDFDFYALVDSIEGARRMSEAARKAAIGRPVQLLLEGGFVGGRAGCRTLDAALAVARAVAGARPHLALRGIEGFEGLLSGATPEEGEKRVRGFVDFLVEIARACAKEGLFAEGPIILSAGGSAYFDLVAERFAAGEVGRDVKFVLRSG